MSRHNAGELVPAVLVEIREKDPERDGVGPLVFTWWLRSKSNPARTLMRVNPAARPPRGSGRWTRSDLCFHRVPAASSTLSS
jgi:hypothetical protein